MKRLGIVVLAVSSLLSACQADISETVAVPDGEAVVFTGVGEATRTDVSETDGSISVSWNDSDEIGVFGERAGKSLGGNYGYATIPADGGRACTFRPLSTGKAFYDAVAGDVYQAYYPYASAAGGDPSCVAVSLPAVQVQAKENDLSHLSDYMVMVSRPVTVANVEENVSFEFHGLFSIVELRIRLNESSALDEVPLKKITLVSEGSDIAFDDAAADITAFSESGLSYVPVNIVSGSRAVELAFGDKAVLNKEYASFYVVVAPGEHPSGDMRLEITASDNSVNTVDLTGDISFRSNRRYTKSLEINLDDFVAADPFDVNTDNLTVKAGEPVDFVFSGAADRIVFYSGELGHDYVYAEKGRPAEVYLNFFSLYYNGVQRDCVSVKYSYDFKLEYDGSDLVSDESAIKAATWFDVSDEFTLPPYITNVDPEAQPITDPYDSGTVDISNWFADGHESLTFAFFYHVDKYDASYVDEKTGTQGNGRTWFQLYTLLAQGRFDDGSSATLVEMKKGDHNQVEIIHGDSYADEPETQHCMKNVSSGGTTVIRMQATFRAPDDRDAYIVTKPIVRPYNDPDEGVSVKNTGEIQPEGYSYVFVEPGTYKAVFVGEITTLYGQEKVTKEFEITVTE